MTRAFDADLLCRYLIEVYDYPEPVARETIEKLRLDGDGLMLNEVLNECEAWHKQTVREAQVKEEWEEIDE